MDINNIETIEKELQTKLSSVREELQKLILDRDMIKAELQHIRDELNSKRNVLSRLRNDLNNSRSELSSLYNSLNNTKNELTNLREKLRSDIIQVKQASSLLKRYSSIATNQSIDEIREEIEKLEWILITTPNIELDEEKKIVEKISQLEKKLKELTSYQKDSVEIYIKYKELNDNINDTKNKIKEKIEILNNIRSKIKQAKETRDKLKNEIVNLLNVINELKKRREELKNKFMEIKSVIASKSNEYKNIIKELNRLKELKEQSKTSQVLEQKKKEIRNKIERGERVTIHELYIAFGDREENK